MKESSLLMVMAANCYVEMCVYLSLRRIDVRSSPRLVLGGRSMTMRASGTTEATVVIAMRFVEMLIAPAA
jgi:hypothetical protein